MKYALQLNERIEATPKASAICPCCGTDVVAKCGTRKIWHWAHKTKQTCDHWWENETQWHRDWKNRFPKEWQEVVHKAENGEKHIADVKTPDGLVIEFQHSYIRPEECEAREKFYGNMIWIVDGRRAKNDLKRLNKIHMYSVRTPWYYWKEGKSYIFNDIDTEEHLPKAWLSSSVKVYFDWGFIDRPGDYVDGYFAPPWNSHLICLEPQSLNDPEQVFYKRSLHAIDKTKFLVDLKSQYNEAPF
jgi:competence protein CoiA